MDALDPKYLLEKLDVVFDSLKRAAKLTVALGFLLKNVEDGSSGNSMHTKIIQVSRDLNMWLLQKTWQKSSNTDIIE